LSVRVFVHWFSGLVFAELASILAEGNDFYSRVLFFEDSLGKVVIAGLQDLVSTASSDTLLLRVDVVVDVQAAGVGAKRQTVVVVGALLSDFSHTGRECKGEKCQ
jgi:hypothetical protein